MEVMSTGCIYVGDAGSKTDTLVLFPTKLSTSPLALALCSPIEAGKFTITY
jgi:hypothetical protein